jgi:hypothetical protein
MLLINKTALTLCQRTVEDSLGWGCLWFNDMGHSTHVIKLQSIRLQQIGHTTLVWNNDELMFTACTDVWAVKSLLFSKGVFTNQVDWALPDEPGPDEPIAPEDWEP